MRNIPWLVPGLIDLVRELQQPPRASENPQIHAFPKIFWEEREEKNFLRSFRVGNFGISFSFACVSGDDHRSIAD